MERVGTAWSRVGAILLGAWVVAGPPAYLVVLLSLGVGRLPIALALVGWTVASVAVTVVVRLRATGSETHEEPDEARATFRTFAQRASLAANTALLAGGLVLVVAMVIGRVDHSLRFGAAPGLIIGVVGGFLLLAAVAPVAVVNAMWTFSRRTASVERAVLDGTADGDRLLIVRARVVAAVAWTAYGALAVLLAVAAASGAI
jgi:hypothetical protein